MANKQNRPIPEMTAADIERFWSGVDKHGAAECWPWKRYRTKRGYGRFQLLGVAYSAHRIALFLATGTDPGELLACHSCDNPPCCNGAHLRPDDNYGNLHERTLKGRAAKGDKHGSRTHPETRPRGDNHPRRRRPELVKRGEAHHKAKLTWVQVHEIRKRYAAGDHRTTLMGREYGVNRSIIHLIVNNRLWIPSVESVTP